MSVVSFVGAPSNPVRPQKETDKQREEAIALIQTVRRTQTKNVRLSDRDIVCSNGIFSRKKYLDFAQKMSVFNHDKEGGVPMSYTVPYKPLLETSLDGSELEDAVNALARNNRFDVSTTIDRVLAACGEPLFGILNKDDGWNLLETERVFVARCTEKACPSGPEICRVDFSKGTPCLGGQDDVDDVCGLQSIVVCSGRDTANKLLDCDGAKLYNFTAAIGHFYPRLTGGVKSVDNMMEQLNAMPIILQSIASGYPESLFVKK